VFSLFPRLRQLLLPGTAQPNDPALVMGPDLPPCMRSRYAWAILGRPQGTVTGGINGPATWFVAGRSSPGIAEVDEGWLVYDQGTVCGFVVTVTQFMNNFGGAVISPAYVFGSTVAAQGVASYAGPIAVQFGFNAPAQPVQVVFGSSDGNPNQSRWIVDNVSMGRGLRAEVSSAVNSAAIGAEAVVLTTPAMTFYDGRCYQVWAEFDAFGSVANNPQINIRQTNLAGALLLEGQFNTAAGTAFGHVVFTGNVRRTAGSDLTDNLVLTLQSGAGTVTQRGSATALRRMEIRDIGDSGKYPNAIAI
jgi:hypothetical protein